MEDRGSADFWEWIAGQACVHHLGYSLKLVFSMRLAIFLCYMAVRNKEYHTTLCHKFTGLEMGHSKAQGNRKTFHAISDIVSFWQIYCFM